MVTLENLAKAGYSVTQPLCATGRTAIFRAVRQADQRRVILKVLQSEHPERPELERLRQDFDLARRLGIAAVVQPLELRLEQPTPMLVLEDSGGEALECRTGEPMSPARFLPLAVHIAAALAEIHQRGVLHRDIKPANLILQPGSGEVKFTDFGIASIRVLERKDPGEPALGTPAYMAPEQTGRVNRIVDCRSDLYSLGVTLYQLLTGRLPFDAEDLPGWFHCHLARTARAPGELVTGIPRPLSDLVMRLLEKLPEDRYQTAAGLLHDLERCRDELSRTGRIEPFVLGQRDVAGQFHLPQHLYGREQELLQLLAAFQRTAQGRPELVLVSGQAGIGKTQLVLELKWPVVRENAYFLSGKFDQFRRGIPYETVAGAIGGMVDHLLAGPEPAVERWRQAILEAVGPNGRILADLVPRLSRLLGPQPPVPDLPPADARRRFHDAMSAFLGAFSRGKCPLVLFLDDLQWADEASLSLLGHLTTSARSRHLLVIGAFRDGEVGSSHPLAEAIAGIRHAGAAINELALGPLPEAAVVPLLRDSLRAPGPPLEPLAALLGRKTGGNPFFLFQFLTSLRSEGLLTFNPQAAAWQWDLGQIQARAFTDNIVGFMVEKLRRLPDRAQAALQMAACAGGAFEFQSVADASGCPAQQVEEDLAAASREGLVIYSGKGGAFLHDRIQQAAYEMVPATQRSEAHWRIGQGLLARTPEAALPDRVFEIVSQFNLGVTEATGEAERVRLAGLNLLAGRRAKASAAHGPALSYFSKGIGQLPPKAWEEEYELCFALRLERAQGQLLTGAFEEAGRALAGLLEQARNAFDAGEVWRVRVELHLTRGEMAESVEASLAGLRLFGMELAPHPGRTRMLQEYEALWRELGTRPVEALGDLPAMEDRTHRAAMAMLCALYAPAYWTDTDLQCLVTCRMVRLSLAHGNDDASAVGYAAFARVLGPEFGRYEKGYRFGQLAWSLAERRDLLAYKARIADLFGLSSSFWVRPLREGLEWSWRALHAARQTGDLTYACYACFHILHFMLASGTPLEALWEESGRRLQHVRNARYAGVAEAIAAVRSLVRSLREGASFSFGSPGQWPQASKTELLFSWCLSMEVRAALLAGNHAAAAAAAREAEPMIASITTQLAWPEHAFHAALAYAAEPQPDVERIAAHCGRLAAWASHGPETFTCRHALVAAELARVRGEPLAAESLYEQAIRSADAQGFLHIAAMGSELAGRFHLGRGLETCAHAHLREARHRYDRWGAAAKVRQLEEEFPRLHQHWKRSATSTGIESHPEQIDLMAVVKAQQAISSELTLAGLMSSLLRALIENAGAQAGALLLLKDGRLTLEAEASPEGIRTGASSPGESPMLPGAILQFVRRTREPVILENACDDTRFARDPVLAARRPKSVLCLPIVRQGALTGLLYLENNLVTGAFTRERIGTVELLAAQAAISLESAHLYEDLRTENAERREAQAEAERQRQRAEAASRAKDQFLAVLSHELRTPLVPVLSGIDALEGDPLLPETLQPALQVMRRNVVLETRLIDDLLELSAVRHGKMALQCEPVDPLQAVREALEICRSDIEAAHLHVAVEPAGTALPPVHADPARLLQIHWNLLKNAARYTPSGGRLTIRIFPAGAAGVTTEMTDTGPGMDAATLGRIFTAFEQGDRQLHNGRAGLGLGLSISRGLAEAMEGTLTARSAGPGQGSTFTLTLPVSKSRPAAPAPPTPPRPPPGPQRILLVEDHDDTRRAVQRLLTRRGHLVETAPDFRSAIETGTRTRFDLLLSDIGLPDGSGLEIMRRLRALDPGLAGIAISGFGAESDIRNSMEAGFAEHLTKPMEFKALLEAITRVLEAAPRQSPASC